eukprot:scaffold7990_cov72-Phaeocystis_antarctica.AAC.2
MQRQAQHAGHPEADGRVVERVQVGYLDLERQLKHRLVDRLLNHLGHLRAAWAEAPGRAGCGIDASCLGIEAWWGILAVAEAAQSTVVPERASGARHCGRCLSGAHGASGALEAHGLAAHVHEAAGLARNTGAHSRHGLDGAGAALGLLGAARRREVANVGLSAHVLATRVSTIRVGALLARQRRAGALGAVRAGLAGDARLLALALLVRAGRALVARALAGVGLDGAGAALVARAGSRAVGSGAKVGPVGVCALAARQRRRGALRAVRARHAHVALGVAGLVHELASAALGTLGLLVQRLHGTLTTRRLLGAARWREVALDRRRALVGAGEVGGIRERALLARQRGAGALGAVRAGLACHARLLALALLVRAGRAPDARGHARVWRDRAGAALTRLGRARTARRSWRALEAVVGARHREVELQRRLVLVRACLARQRGRRALRAVRAGRARLARQLARRGLEGAGLALGTRAHVGVGRDRAGAARRLPGATGWRVVALGGRRACLISCEVGGVRERALLARQRGAGALGAERAGLAGDARLLALALLIRAGRALVARALAGVGLDGAGAALGLLGAARRREVARVGSRAVGSGAKVRPVGMCTLAARQRRRGALRAVRARHAHVALGVAGLVHELARAALVALGPLDQRLHGACAARRLLGAARRRKVALARRRALVGANEAGGAGVRAR